MPHVIISKHIPGGGGGGGGGSLTITDGVTTVAGTTLLTVNALTVGGTTPNATLGFGPYGEVSFSSHSSVTGKAGHAWGTGSASGNYSTAFGVLCAASGFGSTTWGLNNQATNIYATAWGSGNIASGNYSTAFGGNAGVASGFASTVWGESCNAGGTFSTVFGYFGTDNGITNALVFGAGYLTGTKGDTQFGKYALSIQTTDATPTVLTADLAAPSTNNQVILLDNHIVKCQVTVSANSGTDYFSTVVDVIISRGAGAGTTAILTTVPTTPAVLSSYKTAGAAAWTVTFSADTTNGGLAVTGTGAAATNINWQAKVETMELVN